MEHSHSCFIDDCFKAFVLKPELDEHLTKEHGVLYARIHSSTDRGIVRTERSQANADIVQWAEEWIRYVQVSSGANNYF